MPYADKKDQKRWTRRAMKDGYGKRLYARRKLQIKSAEKFRETLEEIISVTDNTFIEPELKLQQIRQTAAGVLALVDKEGEELKGWTRSDF